MDTKEGRETISVSLTTGHVNKLTAIGRQLNLDSKNKRSAVVRYLIELGHKITAMSAAHKLLFDVSKDPSQKSFSEDVSHITEGVE